ncbi:MAG: ferrous iron transporter B [Pseudomonadota bacterium]
MAHCKVIEKVQSTATPLVSPGAIAIVGPPNAGKSVLFNGLTGNYSLVANYPQTTVMPLRRVTRCHMETVCLVDTPGLNALAVHSQDERSTVKVLLQEKIHAVLFCGDALNLKRSLVLLAQILELELPTLVCLNRADLAASSGMAIHIQRLAELLGLPVIETAVEHGIGFDQVKGAIAECLAGATPMSTAPIRYPAVVEQVILTLNDLFPLDRRPSRGLCLLFLQGDTLAEGWFANYLGEEILANAHQIALNLRNQLTPHRLLLSIFQSREGWANRLAEKTLHQAGVVVPTLLQTMSRATRHPILGWPIFLGILWLTFKGVGFGALELGGWMDATLFAPLIAALGKVISPPLLNEFLVGQFGILTMGVANAMVTVVPILLVFFFIVHLLEDIGYLPNLSVLANRSLLPLGLSGKAVLPLILGSGCNTTATLSSRILATRKERLLVSFLVALGVPCSVQLGVLFAILATMPFSALLIVLGAVLTTTVTSSLLMNRLLSGGTRPGEFIMEIPPFQWPHPGHILKKTLFRIKWFLEEAVPLFMLAAGAMFIIDKTGLLDMIKSALRPVVTGFLGMPDKVTEVFILVLARREVGAIYFRDMATSHLLDYNQIVTGLVVITLFIPCISNTMVMFREFGARWAVGSNLAIVAIAILVGGLVHALLSLI